MGECILCQEASGSGAPLAFVDAVVAVFPAALQPEKNQGSVLVVTVEHIETLYDLPDEGCAELMKRVRDIARAVQRAAGASGTTIRQNNHPPGQEVPHLHFHIAPRFEGDDYWRAAMLRVSWDDRVRQAQGIAAALTETLDAD